VAEVSLDLGRVHDRTFGTAAVQQAMSDANTSAHSECRKERVMTNRGTWIAGAHAGLVRHAALAIAMIGALAVARWAQPQARRLGFESGQRLMEPLALHSVNGVLDVDLFLQQGQAQFGGMTVENVWTYHVDEQGPPNYPGPTLYVNPGDTLRIHYVNQLDQETNLHTHGLHVSPLGNSDNVVLIIPAGASNDYEIRIPSNHPEGLYWYHPHRHGFVDQQIYQGLSGLLVIGRPDGGYKELNGIRQRLLALRYDYVTGGAINQNIPVTALGVFMDLPHMLFTVNGQLNPTIDIVPGELQAWNVGNISDNGYFYVHLRGTNGAPDQPLILIAQDGNPYSKPVILDPSQRLLIPPGQRYSVLVQGPPAGTYELAMEQYSDGFFLWPNSSGSYSVGQPLATMVSAGRPPPVAFAVRPIPTKLTPPPNQGIGFEPLNLQPVDYRRNAVFSISSNFNFLINGQQFPNNPVFQPRLDTVEEWTLLNNSFGNPGSSFGGTQHPYHIHVNDFQLQSVFAPVFPAFNVTTPQPRFQDIINLPGGALDANGNVTFPGQAVVRMKPRDFLGTYVYHCHRVDHEDAGMMALITIIPRMPAYATGAGPGSSTPVVVFNGNSNRPAAALSPFAASVGTRVALGDVNNDGVMDLVVVPSGPGSPPRVRVFDGKSGFQREIRRFLAFPPEFRDGLNVAAGDVNSDGFDDIIVGPASGPPEVRVFSGKDGSMLSNFMAYEPEFKGGVRLAAGILQDGGRVSIVTSPGPGRAPEVRVFDVDWYGQHQRAHPSEANCSCKKGFCGCGERACACSVGKCGCSPKPVGSLGLPNGNFKPIFQTVSQAVYASTFLGGVNVGAGPLDGQNGGFGVIITGPGAGAPPLVQTFVLNNPATSMIHERRVRPQGGAPSLVPVSSFMAYSPLRMQGVTVSAVSTPTGADLVVGPGPGVPLAARRFRFDPVDQNFTLIDQALPYGFGFRGGFSIAGK
jgi:FtsP/CotA-like multicopper oxidase with cupredoxin domain